MSYATTTQARHFSGLKTRVTLDGLHLFNRVTGTNILIDEISPSPEYAPAAPRQVSIALTNACDLSCEYCYAPKNPAGLFIRSLSPWLCELDSHGVLKRSSYEASGITTGNRYFSQVLQELKKTDLDHSK